MSFNHSAAISRAALGSLRPTVLAALLAISAPVFAQSDPVNALRDLINAGRMKEAYALARDNEAHLGDPAFDFLFGLAATDSGHAAAAVLALERVVSAFPEDQNARLELARAYFILGEDARSAEEFNSVLAKNPPQLVKDNIQRFLDAIRARQTAYNVTTRGFIETGVGHDSNVNAGPARSFALPSGAAFTITDDAAVGLPTYFVPYAAGMSVSAPFRPGMIASFSAAADGRNHNGSTRFEQNSYDLAAGLSILDEDNLYRATLGYTDLELDGARYRHSINLGGEYQRQLSIKNIASIFTQLSTLRYTGTNSNRDGKSIVVGTNWRHALLDKWATQLTAALFFGRDLNGEGRHDFSRDLTGVRLGVSTSPHGKWVVSGGLNYARSNYFDPDQSFLGAINQNPIALALSGPEPSTRRDDTSRGIDVGATWLASRTMSVRLDLNHTRSESNIEVYSYRRTAYSVKARYEFF
ncbi:MAG: hypothetical protein RIR70_689 [Pseudomonadota bacterium]